MFDKYGRNIEYLRVSLTEKCNLQCVYCNSKNTCNNLINEIMSPDDFYKVIKIMSQLGIRKVRLTGGEPLLRYDICEIIEKVSSIPEINDIALTTNGIFLEKYAFQLKKAGLKRVNISIDTLNANKYKKMTRSNINISHIFSGIQSAISANLLPIRINVVLIKGQNDNEIDDFINLTREMPVDVRFIELMPFVNNDIVNNNKIIHNIQIINSNPHLKKRTEIIDGPAQYYSIEGHKGLIGFISPMSHKFCNLCNRIRLTSDAKLIPCLGKNEEVDILNIIKEENNGKLKQAIKDAIFNKPEGHCFIDNFDPKRKMSRIGG